MKSVLLVDPTYNPGNIPPNLGLGKIEASLIAHNVNVDVCDFIPEKKEDLSLAKFKVLEQDFIQYVVEKSKGADVVYITGSHGLELKPYAMFPRIGEIAAAVKASNKDAVVVFGGALATFYTSVHKINAEAFKEYGIDHVASGQEQNAAKAILSYCDIKAKNPLALSKRDLTDSASQNAGIIPLWNTWDLGKYPDYMSIMVQTGCPYQCSFCFEGKVYDPTRPQATPRDIVSGLGQMREKHVVNGLMIEDSIALSFPWFPQLVTGLAKADISWAIYARANEILQKKDQLVDIVAAGCKSAIVGIESLEDTELIATDKRTTAKQNIQALEAAKKAGLAIQGCFIVGFPEDTIEECERRVQTAINFGLSTYRWHIMQPDWSRLPRSMMGVEGFSIRDHFEAQVSVPDSCLLEMLDENTSPVFAYDEHTLMRLINQNAGDIPSLERFGYEGQFNLRELFNTVRPIIHSLGIPTNEDEMYPHLFNPALRR